MATADAFGRISAVLSVLVPDAELTGIGLDEGDGRCRVVTLWTRAPGRLVGRRGATADGLRAALAERLEDDRLKLIIRETPEPLPPDPRPPEGPGVMYPPE